MGCVSISAFREYFDFRYPDWLIYPERYRKPVLHFRENRIDQDLWIYPNPSYDIIDFNSSNIPIGTQIKIRNSHGQIVLDYLMKNYDKEQISISHLSKGIYFVDINTNFSSASIKLYKAE